jgi:YVTN family beta-propeller protein
MMIVPAAIALLLLAALASSQTSSGTAAATKLAIVTVAGMPPVVDALNLYSETTSEHMNPATRDALQRIYVPNLRSNDVYVIDPNSAKVVDRYKVGRSPQHIVPSWDMKTLWVTNNAERGNDGSLTPIDPVTGKPGKAIVVDDPYNMYFTPDGKSAIVVAEARKRLDFRDPHTLEMQYSIEAKECGGINHADFSIDGRVALFTCEFQGSVVKIDLVERKVLGYLKLNKYFASQPDGAAAKRGTKGRGKQAVVLNPDGTICTTTRSMPQDIRITPDGKLFYIADMEADGVHVVDGEAFKQVGFVPTGVGTHGLYPSRDGKKLYVANRGSNKIHGPKRGPGRVSVIDFASGKVVEQWPIPGGGSPDMGNVSADGKTLWLSGRFDDVVYAINTTNGQVTSIPVGAEPHGLTVWPQPGRYSLGHTGNLR